MRKGVFQARMDTNWAGQTHKMASGLIIPDLGRRGIFYLCSENKGLYELRGYHETDLCVCFFAHAQSFFLMARHICRAITKSVFEPGLTQTRLCINIHSKMVYV